ncbi:acireductone synthase [Acetobacter sp. TBRC 12305]|uniref:Enolase-phosphatase E1 n=1 Tax=Acetobacter garciniae TaxID=2817435 RepID=A0A939HMQ2_9PROT|nr:acireductone synthase [Acetobacter garciniae]MBO1323746.1 acireductone synthase [Acetobacter garciniae]MBX0343435.1 acireductone synthase [Acetobacter garciniae]
MREIPSHTPRVVLLDIEGTTLPVAFVHKVLFPYARQCLPTLLQQRATDPAVKEALAQTRQMAPGVDPLEQLERWMAEDAKVAPLKSLQGLCWEQGYRQGDLVAELYPDVVPCLRALKAAGLVLAVYSSGSEPAQKLIYGYTRQGDVTDLFSAFFDLRVGGKKEAASYRTILDETGWQAADVVFLSDVVAELDAAAQAGLQVCQIARPEDGTVAGTHHPVAVSLPDAARLFGLPTGLPAGQPGGLERGA